MKYHQIINHKKKLSIHHFAVEKLTYSITKTQKRMLHFQPKNESVYSSLIQLHLYYG